MIIKLSTKELEKAIACYLAKAGCKVRIEKLTRSSKDQVLSVVAEVYDA